MNLGMQIVIDCIVPNKKQTIDFKPNNQQRRDFVPVPSAVRVCLSPRPAEQNKSVITLLCRSLSHCIPLVYLS